MTGLKSRQLLLALGAYGILGMLPLTISPLLVYVVDQKAQLGPGFAGIVTSAALGAVAVGALIGSVFLRRLSFVRLACTGAALLAFAQAALFIVAMGPAALIASWVVAGCGAGLSLAAGSRVLARADNPLAFAGAVSMLASLAGLVILPTSGLLIASVGGAGLGWGVIATVTAALLLILLGGKIGPTGRSAIEPPAATGTSRAANILLLLAAGSIWIRDGMIWSFSAVLGSQLGIGEELMSGVLFAVGVAGMIGSGFAAWIASRRSELSDVMVFASLLSGILSLLWVMAPDPASFALLQIAYNVAQFFLVPLYLGLAAEQDPSGHLIAAVGATGLSGAAIAPALAGALLESSGAIGLLVGLFVMLVLTTGLHGLLKRFGKARQGVKRLPT